MFMRLVQANAKPSELARLRWFYDDRVVPTLQNTRGCLYACLMQSVRKSDEVISLTLWENQSHATAYEASGLFGMLMDEAKPMLADSTEWRVELSRDLTLEQVPIPQEPTVRAFPIAVMSRDLNSHHPRPPDLFLRIVSVKLKPEKQNEFQTLYLHEIIPTLHDTKGCRHAYLLMPGGQNPEALSITIWETKEAADEYEQSGRFAELVDRVKHTFTDLFQWRMKLDHHQRETATSDDITVDRYYVMAAKRLK
ncbi:MAG: antibiotic biosynthesis monooxygenase [Ignavibacteriales bacterium]|nr:antibiotic biosynthesis monooxygenase [Ignavibacteriales bacterium]